MSRKGRWILWSGYVLAWTALLVMPSVLIENVTGRGLDDRTKYLIAKTVHISAYAIMTILCGWLQVPARFRWLLVYFLMGHSTFTEIMQHYLPIGRTGTLQDVAFNNVGITIGLIASWKWWIKKSIPADEAGQP